MRTFIETFDNGPCGWIGWDGKVGSTPVEIRDGAAVSRGPWWVDANHIEPPEGAYLHILFALHTKDGPEARAVRLLAGPNPYVDGGFPTNLTNAKMTFRLKGDVKLRGAELVLHLQGNVPTAARPMNVLNQELAGQPLKITRDWSEQTIHLAPDPRQWRDMGSRHDRRDRYGKGPIADLLRDVNLNMILVLAPLDVVPAGPLTGDPSILYAGGEYEVDRSRLPEGHVMLDEVRIEFP